MGKWVKPSPDLLRLQESSFFSKSPKISISFERLKIVRYPRIPPPPQPHMKTYPWVDEMFDVDVLVEGRVLVGDDVDVLLRISPAAEDQGAVLITPRPGIIKTNLASFGNDL